MSNALRVAILDDFQNVALRLGEWQRLEPGVTTTVFTDNVTGEALVERLQPFDIVMVIRERTKFPRARRSAWLWRGRLRWVFLCCSWMNPFRLWIRRRAGSCGFW